MKLSKGMGSSSKRTKRQAYDLSSAPEVDFSGHGKGGGKGGGAGPSKGGKGGDGLRLLMSFDIR